MFQELGREHNNNNKRMMMSINGPRPNALSIKKAIHKPNHHHHQNNPVIIYTHSPRIIHADAKDFMAVVQKLTGVSSSGEEEENKGVVKKEAIKSESESSSIIIDETCGDHHHHEAKGSSSSAMSSFAEIPLYTPNSSGNLFCSPQASFRSAYLDGAFSLLSPNIGSSSAISSFLEGMK